MLYSHVRLFKRRIYALRSVHADNDEQFYNLFYSIWCVFYFFLILIVFVFFSCRNWYHFGKGFCVPAKASKARRKWWRCSVAKAHIWWWLQISNRSPRTNTKWCIYKTVTIMFKHSFPFNPMNKFIFTEYYFRLLLSFQILHRSIEFWSILWSR